MIDNRILLESGMALVVLVACLFFLIKRGRQGQGFYDVLYISDGKLTILAGIPISYSLADSNQTKGLTILPKPMMTGADRTAKFSFMFIAILLG